MGIRAQKAGSVSTRLTHGSSPFRLLSPRQLPSSSLWLQPKELPEWESPTWRCPRNTQMQGFSYVSTPSPSYQHHEGFYLPKSRGFMMPPPRQQNLLCYFAMHERSQAGAGWGVRCSRKACLRIPAPPSGRVQNQPCFCIKAPIFFSLQGIPST